LQTNDEPKIRSRINSTLKTRQKRRLQNIIANPPLISRAFSPPRQPDAAPLDHHPAAVLRRARAPVAPTAFLGIAPAGRAVYRIRQSGREGSPGEKFLAWDAGEALVNAVIQTLMRKEIK
jgi:hypothetical protein